MKVEDALTELRVWRDEFAESHAYDVRAMGEALRALDCTGERRVVHGEPRRPTAAATSAQARQPAGPAIPIADSLSG